MTYASLAIKCGTAPHDWVRVGGQGPKVCMTCHDLKGKFKNCAKCDKRYEKTCNLMHVCEKCAALNFESEEDVVYDIVF